MEVFEIEEFIKKIHAFQYDKLGVEYFKHPLWVKNHLPEWASNDLKAAALLHDVLEDTDITASKLRNMGISERTLEILSKLTRHKSMSYADYIENILSSEDLDVITLKFTDMKHNLLESRLSLLGEATRNRLLKKYVPNFKKLERWLTRPLPAEMMIPNNERKNAHPKTSGS